VSPSRPLTHQLLGPAEEILDAFAGNDQLKRLDVLEGAAAVLGGVSLETLRATDDLPRFLSSDEALFAGDLVRVALLALPAPPALLLASLAQPPMTHTERRRAGAYYTDFRLAQFLVERLPHDLNPADKVIDAASGTGILLAAAALSFRDSQPDLDRFIAESVCAADLSAAALRGVKLVLASLTADDTAVRALAPRLRQVDSLAAGPAAWEDVAPRGFQVVIGNPPWEKLKLSRHEHLVANGVDRHYGADYQGDGLDELGEARRRMRAYVSEMASIYDREGRGEADLYRLFLALGMRLLAPSGQIGMLVPAGLIRARGTEPLRRELLEQAGALRLSVFENKARFFEIDSRFKFLAMHASLDEQKRRSTLVLDHAAGGPEGVKILSSARLGRAQLGRLRPDLTVPEVRTPAEWLLFRRMTEAGSPLGSLGSRWHLDFARELDMTNDRGLLEREAEAGMLPVIEGRMIHQFRSSHKAYVSGTGRGARWRVTEPGEDALVSQFWVASARLPARTRERAAMTRVGFCDITGQTNERTMLASRIPVGAVCGNKVPTVTFPAHPDLEGAARLWLAVVNSFAFDWLLRRLVTTTVNYFVLRSVPFPSLETDSPEGRRLIELVASIEAGEQRAGVQPTQLAEWRAEIDALVLDCYGVSAEGARLILDDFRLLDRGQEPLPGESRSTVTRDLVLQALGALRGVGDGEVEARVAMARTMGAEGYVPAQANRRERAPEATAIG
jgi:methylase of polypeptide subunit release factors